ncbi:site-specific DNA-methyltransferase [Rhizobium sp. Root1220]|uniref:site-specific DNA-methyltransferase n=1 Tax=Rhizobium sp. Root1220 TaxID=1736432 RepID=UPI00244EE59E|nr:site-specific DNA-methyltransferase [Rhizobium sp. Root1220]
MKNRHPEKTSHPCQFPEDLVERLVIGMSKPGQTVLDPFAGSGTVGAVCNRLERRSVLIERAPEYVYIIRNRLGGANPQTRTQVNEEITLDPSINDVFSVDQTSTVNPGSNPVPSPGYPRAFETILVEPTL